MKINVKNKLLGYVYDLWKADCERSKKVGIESLTFEEFVKAWSWSKPENNK